MLTVTMLARRYFLTYRSMSELAARLQAADQMKDEFPLRAMPGRTRSGCCRCSRT
ncbi:hypothetical protein [Cohnella thermotolerans]|uniref:hypothetical protein n=1 Tax=Cohnella thermotolerans TaxID=329858 RepID=UPI00146FC209|nr:hypothetical protein [Cohnella thermotolerans]